MVFLSFTWRAEAVALTWDEGRLHHHGFSWHYVVYRSRAAWSCGPSRRFLCLMRCEVMSGAWCWARWSMWHYSLTLECRASDKCQREKRKTINGDDLLWAMSTLGFEDYVEPLKVYLHKYREVCQRRSFSRRFDAGGPVWRRRGLVWS